MAVMSCPTRKLFAFSCFGSNSAQLEYPQRRIITKHTFRGSGFLAVSRLLLQSIEKVIQYCIRDQDLISYNLSTHNAMLKKTMSGFSEIFAKIIITFKCREIFRALKQLLIRFRSHCIVFVNGIVFVLSTAMLRCEVQDQ